MQLAFRQGGQPVEARLGTRFGKMWLYLGQVCDVERIAPRRFQLLTIGYQYTLRPDQSNAPLLRWEYVKEPPEPESRWCRHHIQGPTSLNLGSSLVAMDHLHVPTGWVTVEEILRFCIVDLGVTPLSQEWHQILTESYTRFKEEFAPRGQV
jgi:hypothetical protein